MYTLHETSLKKKKENTTAVINLNNVERAHSDIFFRDDLASWLKNVDFAKENKRWAQVVQGNEGEVTWTQFATEDKLEFLVS